MIKRTDIGKGKALEDKIRIAVTQAVLQVVGPEHTVKVISGSTEVADLVPQGQNLSVKMSIDIYEKTS